jgi:CubicO group peptidase (beta-lactamase class C family)
LRLRSRDLLKFAMLYSNGGAWNGKQIVPSKWVAESCQPQIQRAGGGSYGYQFWLWQDSSKNIVEPVVACIGNGGQRIYIDKAHNLVVVVTAGNYNKWDIKNSSDALVYNFVYSALK